LRRSDDFAKIGCAINRQGITVKFSIREGEFSVQYALESDPRFWVRVVKPIGETLVISDALQGSQSSEEMGKALTEVLNNHANDTVNAITIADIVPDLPTGLTDKRRVAERFDLLSAAVRRWALKAGRDVTNGYLDLDHGKFIAVFRLN